MSDAAPERLRVLAHTDFEYHPTADGVRGEHAFTLFFAELSRQLGRLVVLGRVDPSDAKARYPLGEQVDFVGLPYYRGLWRLRESLPAMAVAVRRYWRALDGVELVWLLGPHPLQLAFAAIARLRGRRLALAVRQDTPSYIASRHPDRRWLQWVAIVLDRLWRALASRSPVIVVGPALRRRYRGSPELLEITASLVSEGTLARTRERPRPSYDGRLEILSVGRIEAEKNPLLLADLLALLCRRGSWKLTVAGEGPMLGELEARFDELGVGEHAELAGYVPFGPRLMELYERSHVLAHVSWTEGMPQVLVEAFAAGLPVVATDVGGIAEAVGDAALLVPPGDAEALERAVRAVTADSQLRDRLFEAGLEFAGTRTLEGQARAVAEFLAATGPRNT